MKKNQFVLVLAAMVLINMPVKAQTVSTTLQPFSECGNAFLVNRSNTAAEITIQHRPVNIPLGVFIDINRRLMWIACPLGQSLDTNTSCRLTGNDQLGWQQALQSVEGFNQNISPIDNAGLIYQDWRLPNIKELMSLYRHPSCRLPATDLHVFNLPAIEGSNLPVWSATPDAGNDANALMLDLQNGLTRSAEKTQPGRVWLLRDM